MLMNVLNSAIVYLFIIVGIRLLGKKELGQLSVADLIFIMLISEVVGEAMVADDNSLLGCLISAATLIILNKIIKIIAFRYKKFNELMEERPAILIRHGCINEKEMKKNKINIEELEQAGREHGIGDITTIALAILEVDGKISILPDDKINTKESLDE